MTVMRFLTRGVGVFVAGLLTFASALVLAQAPAPQGTAPGTAAPQGAAPAATTPATPPPPGTIVGTPANDTVKGAALLADARKALGGEDKIKAVQRLEIKGKSARAQQQANLTGDFEIDIELPNKFRRKENLGVSDFNIDIVQLLNGEEGTQHVNIGRAGGGDIGGFDGNGGGGNRGNRGRGSDIARFLTGGGSDDPEQQRKAVMAEFSRLMMGLLATPTSSDPVAWIGVAESPDGKADVLEFKTPDGVATRLLLDQKTHLPLMLAWTGQAAQSFNRGGGNFRGGGPPGGNFPQSQAPNQNQGRRGGNNNRSGPQPLQMHLSDYKNSGGIKFPFLIQSGANDETTEELVVKTVRVNPTFKADLFISK